MKCHFKKVYLNHDLNNSPHIAMVIMSLFSLATCFNKKIQVSGKVGLKTCLYLPPRFYK